MPLVVSLALFVVLALAAAAFGVLVIFARRVVYPRGFHITPATVSDDRRTIQLPATPMTLAPGRYGVWFDDDAHSIVADIVSIDSTANTVVRRMESGGSDVPTGAVSARWSGHVFLGPESLGLPFSETVVSGISGPCPAWLIPADDGGTWAIHIHGYNTGRVTALRGVPAAHTLGFTSLVVSFAGDGEGPTIPGAPSGLGTVEYRDVEAAIEYAVQHGARSIVLFGWSMGGLIALRVAERSAHRDLISGLVLIGPVTGWRWAIEAGAVDAGLPALLGRGVTAFLGTHLGARCVRARRAYPFREFDWTRGSAALAHRTLVLHSTGDTDIPVAASRTLAARGDGNVTLIEFEPIPHCMEWNAEPERFDTAIATWWQARTASTAEGHLEPRTA